MELTQNNNKCPFCGSLNYGKIPLPPNQSHVITLVDVSKQPPEFNPSEGIPIDLYACTDCNRIVPCASSLRKN